MTPKAKFRVFEDLYRRRPLHALFLDRLTPSRFSRKPGIKVAIYCEPDRISFSQTYPFFRYADAFKARFGAEIAARNVKRLSADPDAAIDGADVILLQTWFRIEPERLAQIARTLREKAPRATIAFLDAFAPADLRFARVLDPYIDFYITKSVLRDPDGYRRKTIGDTNLTDFYCRAYGLRLPRQDWEVPENFGAKIRLAPNFVTSPAFYRLFAGPAPSQHGRDIDLHCRIATEGVDWYAAMRSHAAEVVAGLGSIRTATRFGVDRRTFMAEVGNSKICFSPFGYGELCWRDVEAIGSGAVLLKPSMEHLRTEPDLYRADQTYVPVDWLFRDLPDVVADLLRDEPRRSRIAAAAFDTVKRYLAEDGFVDQMAFLFETRNRSGTQQAR